MPKLLRGAWAAGFIACGTLLGHMLAYALDGRSLADGHHAYFAALLEIAVASALFGCAVMLGRAMSSLGISHTQSMPSFGRLWFTVASLQVLGFITIELLEGNAPDAFGCGIEILVALFVAIAMTLFCRAVQRCAGTILYTYAPVARSSGAAVPAVHVPLDAVRSLTVRAGVRRFKRPPPIG